MKLQGWCLISSWCTRISFQASLQAEVEPGNAKTYVPLIIAPSAREWIVEVPIFLKLINLKISPKPSIILSAKFFIVSGVESLPVNPVPPVEIMTSIFLFDDQSLIYLLINFGLSLTIFLS